MKNSNGVYYSMLLGLRLFALSTFHTVFFDNSLLRLVIDRCIIFRILISTDKGSNYDYEKNLNLLSIPSANPYYIRHH